MHAGRNDPGVARKHNVSPTQVTLAWHIARGIVATPTSADEERQREILNASPATLMVWRILMRTNLSNSRHWRKDVELISYWIRMKS